MTSRERILAAMNHEEADRVPMWESYWPTTLTRWQSEGLAEGVDPQKHFGLDAPHMTCTDWTLQMPTEVIEETEEYIIMRTANGALEKNLIGRETTPHWSDFALTDRASWEELKPRMTWNESRINIPEAKAAYNAHRELFQIYMPATLGFEKFKYAMGMENLLMAMATDPDWCGEMFMSTAQQDIDGLDYLMGAGFEFDAAFITEDMGYRDRGFFSPRTYRELIMPCHKRFCDYCHDRAIRVILHTCGMNMELLPLYIEAGFDVLNPLEVKAGMDVYKVKSDFGDVLTLWGGIDVRAIANPDPGAIETEIREKVAFAKRGGGYIFSSDHSIPDNVSMKRYEYMLELGYRYGSFVSQSVSLSGSQSLRQKSLIARACH